MGKLGTGTLIVFIIAMQFMHVIATHGLLRKKARETEVRLTALESRSDEMSSNVVSMVNFDSAVAKGIQQNADNLKQAFTQSQLQDTLLSRALVAEMGKRDYQKEVNKFMAELEAARKAEQAKAPVAK